MRPRRREVDSDSNDSESRKRLPVSRLSLGALLSEILVGLLQRPGRSVLTIVGTVLGVGSLVAILGLTATAQGQISDRFSVLEATGVTVLQTEDAGAELSAGEPYMAFPPDADQRVNALNGVINAGVWWPINLTPVALTVSAYPPGAQPHGDKSDIAVYAATPGAIRASQPSWSQGRGLEAFHQSRGDQVAVLGASAARRLGITHLDAQPAIFIGQIPFTVIGILDEVSRNKEFLASVLVPAATALDEWGLTQDTAPTMTVQTSLGGRIPGRETNIASAKRGSSRVFSRDPTS